MPSSRDRYADLIASSSNPGIKMVRSLQRRKYRQQERAFIVEGVRAVNDVLRAGVVPTSLFLREDFDGALLERVPEGVPLRRVAAPVFDPLTDTAHPQGVLAVVPMLDDAVLPEPRTGPLVLVIDGVRDPGNMGTLLRSAAGAGAAHVVVGLECVDVYHPRVVRAAMGAHLRVPFSHLDWDELTPYLANFDVVGVADARGEAEYDIVDWTSAAAIIVGGEAFGPSSRAYACATALVSIPLANDVESLNAGVAGSLLAFEAARQRRHAEPRGNEGA